MKKKLFLLALCLLLVSGLTACAAAPQQTSSSPKIKVVATIFPLYDFARQVGGERVAVTKLLPAGAEPHSWEPSPKEMAQIYTARLFILNGGGLEPWAEKQQAELQKKGVLVVEASAGLDLIPGPGHVQEEAAAQGKPEEGGTAHQLEGELVDPHVWLDPVLAEQIVKKITDALIEVDPAGKDEYLQRSGEYCQKLKELDEEYRISLSCFAGQKIVVSHEAYGYLTRRYGLEQIGIMGLSPESEPDPKQMKKVIEVCREHEIKYIFFESLVNPRLAEAIAREVGARTLVLSPLANLTPEQEARGVDYLSGMRENLKDITTALEGKI